VILKHSNETPHSTHQTQVVADVSLGMYITHLYYCLGFESLAWAATDSTIMKKWKWLFMSGCTCKSLFSVVSEFFNSCQDGTGASVWSGIMLKIIILRGINEVHSTV